MHMNSAGSSKYVYRYEDMALPAFPSLQCEVAIEIAPEPGKVWVPMRAICEDALHIDNSTQQAKIRKDGRFEHCRRLVPFKTLKGYRDSLALEFEGFIPWLTEIEDSRVDKDSSRYVHTFRKFAWAFLSRLALDSRIAAVAEGRTPEVPTLGPAGMGSAVARPFLRGRKIGQEIIEDRVDALEQAVFVNKTTPTAGRIIHCVACGCPMEIELETLRVVPARSNHPH
jgi:hypothetical protein